MYSLVGRYKQDAPFHTPGPNAYNTIMSSMFKSKRAPSYGIGSGPKTSRDLTTRRIVPGPGNYACADTQPNLQGTVFGK